MTKLRKKYQIESLIFFGVAIFWFFLGEMEIIIVHLTGCLGYLNYRVFELAAKLEEQNKNNH